MAIHYTEIETLLRTAFPDAQIQIQDTMGDGDHYAVQVISSSFFGKSRIAQHKMVYDALEGRMKDVLHALSIKTSLPE